MYMCMYSIGLDGDHVPSPETMLILLYKSEIDDKDDTARTIPGSYFAAYDMAIFNISDFDPCCNSPFGLREQHGAVGERTIMSSRTHCSQRTRSIIFRSRSRVSFSMFFFAATVGSTYVATHTIDEVSLAFMSA